MTETTLIDVLDTAVKIGLGALISGVSTYWLTKQKEKSLSTKEYETRHRDILEKVTENVEVVNHAYLKYWALVVEWLRYKNNKNEWPANRQTELDKAKDELFHAFKSLTEAEAKLLLVNEKIAYKAIRDYAEEVIKFRRTYFIDNHEMTEDQINKNKGVIKEIREKFFEIVSESYQSNIT